MTRVAPQRRETILIFRMVGEKCCQLLSALLIPWTWTLHFKAEWIREFLFMIPRTLSDEIDVTALLKSAYEKSEVMYSIDAGVFNNL